uniref:Secreted protein n=1 Tax=Rhipicephalus appendiculatus TaxID=34631 RepID=A0A131YCT8_RHIAP
MCSLLWLLSISQAGAGQGWFEGTRIACSDKSARACGFTPAISCNWEMLCMSLGEKSFNREYCWSHFFTKEAKNYSIKGTRTTQEHNDNTC